MIVAVPKLELVILVAVVLIGFTGWGLKRRKKSLDYSLRLIHFSEDSQQEKLRGESGETCSDQVFSPIHTTSLKKERQLVLSRHRLTDGVSHSYLLSECQGNIRHSYGPFGVGWG